MIQVIGIEMQKNEKPIIIDHIIIANTEEGTSICIRF